MTKLTDTQSVLLASAAQRDNGSLHPAPETLNARGAALHKAIAALVNQGLAEERETNDAVAAIRSEGDLRYGVFATSAGLAAIGVSDASGDALATSAPPASPAPPRPTKAATIVALLLRPEGATLAELIAVTAWLPHTTRAALTGLRKKGNVIERGKRGEETCYRMVEPA